MPAFSFDKLSCESKLLNVLQDSFFKKARRNKIIAKWAGGRLGLTGSKLNQYVRNMIFSYLITPNDRKMVNQILMDFQKSSISMTEAIILEKMSTIENRIRNKVRVENVD